MNKNLHRHSCRRCKRSYLSRDELMIYCSSKCEGRDKYEERYSHEKKRKICGMFPETKPFVEEKKVPSEKEKWINKKPTSQRPRKDLKEIMYADTFKKWIPKNLKVMRG